MFKDKYSINRDKIKKEIIEKKRNIAKDLLEGFPHGLTGSWKLIKINSWENNDCKKYVRLVISLKGQLFNTDKIEK